MTDLTPPPIPDGFVRRWCETLSEGSESPPGAFLPSALAVLSATLGPRLVMRWTVTHEERMNLWVLNTGRSALARKTSGLSGLYRAISWIREGGDDLARVLRVNRLSDAGLVQSLDVVSADTARRREEEARATPKGHEPRDVDDVVRDVPLAWAAVFNEIAPIWRADGPGWVADAQRTLLEVYDGTLSSTTKATNVPSQECFVTAIGNIPPRVLREQTTLDMLASGFVGRWLVVPTPPPECSVSFPTPNGADPLDRLHGDVERLAELARKGVRHEVNGLWSDRAKYLRDAWYRKYQERIEAAGGDDPIAVAEAELWGRQQATHIKLATLVAASRQFEHITDLSGLRVDQDDVEWAAGVVDNSIAYVTEALRESGADSGTTVGKVEGRVLRFLERKGAVDEASARTITDVSSGTKGGDASRETVLRAIDTLIQTGMVAYSEDGPSGRPRRRVWLMDGGEVLPAGGA